MTKMMSDGPFYADEPVDAGFFHCPYIPTNMPVKGQMYFDPKTYKFRVFDGFTWVDVVSAQEVEEELDLVSLINKVFPR